MKTHRAIFLDRDGTLIESQHYPRDEKLVVLLPGVEQALKIMTEKGFLIFVISNQSGVGRGIISKEQFNAVHKKTGELLNKVNAKIESYHYCFHTPDDSCDCRKPNTGLVPKQHSDKSPIDWKQSYMVGDSACDIELAWKLKSKAILVLTGNGQQTLEKIDQTKISSYATLLDFAKIL